MVVALGYGMVTSAKLKTVGIQIVVEALKRVHIYIHYVARYFSQYSTEELTKIAEKYRYYSAKRSIQHLVNVKNVTCDMNKLIAFSHTKLQLIISHFLLQSHSLLFIFPDFQNKNLFVYKTSTSFHSQLQPLRYPSKNKPNNIIFLALP